MEALAAAPTRVSEQLEPERPVLYLVPDEPSRLPGLIDADTIPELRFTRLRAAKQAADTLEKNRQLLTTDEFDSVPIPVDALGTAKLLAEAEQQHGKDSPQYKELFAGLLLDCSRLFGEAERKNTWEYFEETLQPFDSGKQQYTAHGVPTLDIVERGLSPTTDGPEEEARRVNEVVEEHTYHALRKVRTLGRLGLHKEISVKTISQCTDWAIEAYKTDSKKSHGGYAPGIEKLMIRGIRYMDDDNRQEGQLALPGTFINNEVINEVLQEEGAIPYGKTLTKTDVHGKQFVDPSGQNVISFAKKLDRKAGEKSGKNIYMGEEVPNDFVKDYEAIPEQAELRRQKREERSHDLALHIIELQANKTDPWAAEGIVGQTVQRMLLDIVKQQPELAVEIFDQETADGFAEVARLEASGRKDEALELQRAVEANAPEASYCGAGGCGLEAAMNSQAVAKVRQLGLTGDLIHDMERPCPSCTKMAVYYDTTGSKACANCGVHEIKGKS
jgi:hypothetical protein